jgi:hypothetical protein
MLTAVVRSEEGAVMVAPFMVLLPAGVVTTCTVVVVEAAALAPVRRARGVSAAVLLRERFKLGHCCVHARHLGLWRSHQVATGQGLGSSELPLLAYLIEVVRDVHVLSDNFI